MTEELWLYLPQIYKILVVILAVIVVALISFYFGQLRGMIKGRSLGYKDHQFLKEKYNNLQLEKARLESQIRLLKLANEQMFDAGMEHFEQLHDKGKISETVYEMIRDHSKIKVNKKEL